MSLTSYQAAPPCNKGRANVLGEIFPVNRLLRFRAYLCVAIVNSASFSEMVTLSGVMWRMRK